MSSRWAIYIDIEGFGSKWSDSGMEAFRGINTLMQGIYLIGDRYYREPPDRLFAHQFGDAFLVVSDFHELMLDRAVLVATALLRYLLQHNETAKAAIAEGELSDIQNCYPAQVRHQLDKPHITIGHGVMTIIPVLGSALINAVSALKRAPSGPLLVLSEEYAKRLSEQSPKACGANSRLVSLNWLRGEPDGLAQLQAAAGLGARPEAERVAQLSAYVASAPCLSKRWRESADRYLLSVA